MSEPAVARIKGKSLKYLEDNHSKYVEVLKELVSYKSVAAWKTEDVSACASYIAELLRERGFKVSLKSGGGAPAVFAEAGSGSRTVLIYNHYDVQPPDPLDLWDSDPFKLVIKEGHMFGRGVADNKGNIAARIGAVDSLMNYLEDLDLKVKFLIEGEEEIGSPTLSNIVMNNIEWVKADGGIWETGYVRRDGRLGISLGFKGMLYVEVVLRGAVRDVHSGNAPLIPNPVWRLAKLLTLLKSEDGVVYVPEFYEGVDSEFLSHAEELMTRMNYEELEEMKKELGLREFVRGLKGVEALRELLTKPSLNVSGLYSGYTGKGSKTIVPSVAGVKIDIRPVPGQKPERMLENLKKYLENLGYRDVEITIESMYPAGYTKASEDIVRASVEAAREIYGKDPELAPISAGSGPMYLFTNVANIPMTGAGVGYHDSRGHAPNENIREKDFLASMKHVATTLINFSKWSKNA